ncbi:hypothetical protein AB1Y20_020925 [Prymnesium parvum]|uniref:Uncharacterized protein n=1 Tax=Prymnesium parvum TaxID=97485 RepID=A0AB34JI73_PRYPA
MLALASCFLAAAFVPSSTPTLRTPAARPLVTPPVQLSVGRELVESGKALVLSTIGGGMVSAPVKASVLAASKKGITDEWEFTVVALAINLALFGVIYRCIVRSDDNDTLKFSAVAALSLCRALSSMQVYYAWTKDMWIQLLAHFGESALAFGGAACFLEFAWNRGWARRLPCSGLPPYYRRHDELLPPYNPDIPPAYFLDDPVNRYGPRDGGYGGWDRRY